MNEDQQGSLLQKPPQSSVVLLQGGGGGQEENTALCWEAFNRDLKKGEKVERGCGLIMTLLLLPDCVSFIKSSFLKHLHIESYLFIHIIVIGVAPFFIHTVRSADSPELL